MFLFGGLGRAAYQPSKDKTVEVTEEEEPLTNLPLALTSLRVFHLEPTLKNMFLFANIDAVAGCLPLTADY